MAAKAVVRDAGRVLGLRLLATSIGSPNSIPFELDITLDSALEKEPELYANCYADDDRDATDSSISRTSLEGLTRNAGKHAGGVRDRTVGDRGLRAALLRRGWRRASSPSSTKTTSKPRAW
jgi:hypothetical protein